MCYHYTSEAFVVGIHGFEPRTSRTQTGRAAGLR